MQLNCELDSIEEGTNIKKNSFWIKSGFHILI
jgi:hypothetical protein